MEGRERGTLSLAPVDRFVHLTGWATWRVAGTATKHAKWHKIFEILIAWLTTVPCPARGNRLPDAVAILPLERAD